MLDRHAIAQHTRNKLGIVPVLGVELLREALDGGFVATTVFELEIIALGAIGVHLLDDFTRCNGFGQHDTILVVGQSCKYLVRIAIQQSYQSHPFFTVILETHHVALQHLGAHFGHLRATARHEDIERPTGQREQQLSIIGRNRIEALIENACHALYGKSGITMLTNGCQTVSNTFNKFTTQVFFHI